MKVHPHTLHVLVDKHIGTTLMGVVFVTNKSRTLNWGGDLLGRGGGCHKVGEGSKFVTNLETPLI